MKTLITGASGFIGIHLATYLMKKDYDIRCLVRDKSKIALDVDVVEGDIRSVDVIKKALRGVDVVVHLAAVKYHYMPKDEIRSVNIDGTRNIIENGKKVKHLIFSSTFLADKPTNEYAKTKRECEDIIRNSGIKYTILKLSPVFGRGDNTNFTKMISMIKKYPIIPIPGNGKQPIHPLHIDDLNRIIERVIAKKQYGTYSVIPEKCTVEEFVNAVMKELGQKRIKIHLPLSVVRIFAYLLRIISRRPFITANQLSELDTFEKKNNKHVKRYNYKFLTLAESVRRTM